MLRSSLEILPVGGQASTAAVRWRQGAEAHLTLVVKGTFALAPGNAMTLAAPAPIHADDLHADGDRRRSVVAPSDLTPRRPKADVVVTGSVYASAEQSLAGVSVGVAVLRDDRALVSKKVRVVGDRVPGLATVRPFTWMPLVYERAFGGPGCDDNPIGTGAAAGSAEPNLVDPLDPRRTACFGPIPLAWPARARLLGSLHPAALAEHGVELPTGLDWACFQSAPADLRCDYLRGDEWIVLENVYSAFPVLRTRLPDAKAVGKLYGLPGHAGGLALNFEADGLHVDTERAQCHVTWRATLPLATGIETSRLHAAAGIEIAGRPVAWPKPPPSFLAGDATLELRVDKDAEVSSETPAPPAKKEREPVSAGGSDKPQTKADLFGETLTITTAPATVLPFRAASSEPRASSQQPSPYEERPASRPEEGPKPAPGGKPADPFSGTMDLTSSHVPSLLLPFIQGSGAAERRAPLPEPPRAVAAAPAAPVYPPPPPPVVAAPPAITPPPVVPAPSLITAQPAITAPPVIKPTLTAAPVPKTAPLAPGAPGFSVPAPKSGAAPPPTPAKPPAATAPSAAKAPVTATPPPEPVEKVEEDDAPAEDLDAPERYSTPESRAQARTRGALMVAEDDELERFLARHVAPESGLGRASLVQIRTILRSLAHALTHAGGSDAASRISDARDLLYPKPGTQRERRRRPAERGPRE